MGNKYTVKSDKKQKAYIKKKKNRQWNNYLIVTHKTLITYQLELDFQEFDILVLCHLHCWEGIFAYLHQGLQVGSQPIRGTETLKVGKNTHLNTRNKKSNAI